MTTAAQELVCFGWRPPDAINSALALACCEKSILHGSVDREPAYARYAQEHWGVYGSGVGGHTNFNDLLSSAAFANCESVAFPWERKSSRAVLRLRLMEAGDGSGSPSPASLALSVLVFMLK